jgi:predicted O-linked N-acetylglucosamine transferase (SPINDLY family)
MNPQVGFLLNKSLESIRRSNLESAELFLKQALRLQSNNPHVLRLLGVTAAQKKKYSEALDYLNTSLKYLSKNPLTLSNLGNIFLELKEYSNALDAYDKSIKIDPKYEEAWSNKGNVLFKLKRYDEAIAHYDKAIGLKPDYAEAWSNKGNTLSKLKCYEEALAHHNKAISLKSHYDEAWSNKGALLNELRHYEEAIACFDQTLILKPNFAEAWANKGIALGELKHYEETIAHYSKALSLKPDIDWIYGELIHTKMKIASWNNIQEEVKNLIDKVSLHHKIISPFLFKSLADNPFLHQQCAKIYAQDRYPPFPTLGPILKCSKKEKIRLGYFSPDFRKHPVAFLTSELFELHDRSRFEIFAFSLQKVPEDDEITLRLRKGFDHFIDVQNLSDLEIARMGRELELDIAIDLAGPTLGSRTEIFSYRTAPIQVNWLGYPGTFGADFIDYIIADHTIIPESDRQYYCEKVAYLPHTYMVDDSKRVASSRVFTRQECNLPEDAFIFCSFNNSYKLNQQTLDSWSRILLNTGNSILWIPKDNAQFNANIVFEFEQRGIAASRIIFATRVDLMTDHLARFALADLFLDTSPFNGHSTVVDSLKADVPVITRPGNSFASRVAASLLNAIQLPELIVATQEEYEALAIELATNPQRLLNIKQRLSHNRLTTPLFDTPMFTKHLEMAYTKMMERYQADLQPDHLLVG